MHAMELFLTVGSSPLARGLQGVRGRDYRSRRIIPARAGFTPTTSWRSGARWDHPRSRGVYRAHPGRHHGPGGSSPLARGLRDPGGVGEGQEGIIPARAGFTVACINTRPNRADHPRSRGVYRIENREQRYREGSSPLARGLQGSGEGAVVDAGIIPARAGFTALVPQRPGEVGDHPRSRGVYQVIRIS